jgi:predicted Rossmann-fold nucleotide-binding protein
MVEAQVVSFGAYRNPGNDRDLVPPCGILNVLGYYAPLLATFDHAVEERFLKTENRGLVLARESAADLLRALEQWRPARVEKWLDRDTR